MLFDKQYISKLAECCHPEFVEGLLRFYTTAELLCCCSAGLRQAQPDTPMLQQPFKLPVSHHNIFYISAFPRAKTPGGLK
jgi:hypothetical protein